MNTQTFCIIFFALVASTTAGPLHERVVGGDDASPHQFPHQVSLQWRYANGKAQHFCGGSVLNESFVLTAGHCFMEDDANGHVEVVAGDHNLTLEEGTEQRRRVAAFVVNEDYVGSVAPHDIALIKVTQPFVLNENVKTVELPKAFAVPHGESVISGWGSTSRTMLPKAPTVLQTAELPVVDYNQCKKLWTRFSGPVHWTNVCAGDLDGSRATCKGDSGGPLVQKVGDSFVQVGVVSWGAFPCGTHDTPGVFVGVSNYLSWITEQVNKLQ